MFRKKRKNSFYSEGTSYFIEKRISWVLSHQETVKSQDGLSVRSDPGNLDLKYIYPSSEWTFSADENVWSVFEYKWRNYSSEAESRR